MQILPAHATLDWPRLQLPGHGRRGGGGPSVSPRALFAFSDDFGAGEASIALREGWDWRGNNGPYQAVQISGGELPLIDGYNVLPAALVDTGNVRGGSIVGTLGASWAGAGNTKFATLKCAYVDEGNYLEAYINNGASLQLRRCINGTITTVYTAAQVTTNSDVLRADWDWDGDTCTVALWLNGARWPNASTSWQIAASGGLVPSGRAGLGARTVWSAVEIDAPTVAPRLTIARPNRLYQARTDGLRSVPIGGTCNGVAAIEMRVTQGGNVLPGWDWGQVPIAGLVIDGTAWSGAVPNLPRGTGYRIEVRSAADHEARSATWLIDIGDVVMIEGQSLAVAVMGGRLRTMAAQPHAWFPRYAVGDTDMSPDDFGRQWGWAGLAPFATATSDADVKDSTLANLSAQLRNAGSDDGVLVRNVGRGSTAIAEFRPGSTLQPYANSTRNLTGLWHDALDALGGDCAALVWSQGQEDMGRNYAANTFGPTEAAAYKTAFAEIVADRRAAAGRSAADLPVLICGLGRLYPPSGAQGDYVCDAAYDLARRTQYELTQEVANCHLSHSEMDLPLTGTALNEVHLSPQGYAEEGARIGAALARIWGLQSWDRRGPLPVSAAASGNTIIVTYDANGAGSITCAAAIATNLAFWSDAGCTVRETPSAMSIGALSGGQIELMFTFSTAPGTAWRVTSGKAGAWSTGGIYPDVANALIGRYPDNGIYDKGVMTAPIWGSLEVT